MIATGGGFDGAVPIAAAVALNEEAASGTMSPQKPTRRRTCSMKARARVVERVSGTGMRMTNPVRSHMAARRYLIRFHS
jgi:hypothetical protein